MKKITTLLNANAATKNAQVQETLLVTAILAVIVTVSILFVYYERQDHRFSRMDLDEHR